MYVRGYLQGSENGRVVTIVCTQLFDKVMTCLTLQDKQNICTLSAKIKFICTHFETGEKNSPEAQFSYCF